MVCTCFPGVTASVFYCFVVPLDATMPGRCHSNEKWLEKDEFKSWMKKSGKNPKKVFYFACKKRIDLNVMGESTLKRKKLEEYVRLCGTEKAFRISEFFISSVSKTMVQSTGSRLQQLIETSQMAIVATAAAPHKSSVAKYPVSSLLKCNNKGRVFRIMGFWAMQKLKRYIAYWNQSVKTFVMKSFLNFPWTIPALTGRCLD